MANGEALYQQMDYSSAIGYLAEAIEVCMCVHMCVCMRVVCS